MKREIWFYFVIFLCVCDFFPPFQLFPKRKRFDFIQLFCVLLYNLPFRVFVCATSNDRVLHSHNQSSYVITFGTRNKFGMWSKKSVINFIHSFFASFCAIISHSKYAHNDVNYVNWHDIRYERELLMYKYDANSWCFRRFVSNFDVWKNLVHSWRRHSFIHCCLHGCTTLFDEYN